MSALPLTHLISAALMIVVPVLLGIFLVRKFHLGWGIWWVGGVTFVLSQGGHIPFNIGVDLLFERGWLPNPPQEWSLVFSAAFLGLSAGVWEEWFRWIAYRWWVPKARTWQGGVLLGAGHGGIESILLGILSLVTVINILVLNQKDPALLVPADQMQIARSQLEAYWSLPWFYPLLGIIERLFTLPLHITASVLVLQAFTRQQIRWVWIAVLWHAAIDAIMAVYLPSVWRGYSWAPYALEAILGLTALVNIAVLFLLKPKPTLKQPASQPSPSKILTNSITTPEVTLENLDNSRYSE